MILTREIFKVQAAESEEIYLGYFQRSTAKSDEINLKNLKVQQPSLMKSIKNIFNFQRPIQ